MATADKLKKYVTDIGNAIRKKEGSTELINPQDFAQRIDNLQVGGGTSESNIEYLDVSGMKALERAMLTLYCAMFARGTLDAGDGNVSLAVCSLTAFTNDKAMLEWSSSIQAIQVDLSQDIIVTGVKKSISDILAEIELQMNMKFDLSSLPRLTKEQFYSLE